MPDGVVIPYMDVVAHSISTSGYMAHSLYSNWIMQYQQEGCLLLGCAPTTMLSALQLFSQLILIQPE